MQFDVNSDNIVNLADRETWVSEIAMTFPGDTNLDRSVKFDDFLPLAFNFGELGGWGEGDFDGSGDVQFLDFILLASNFGKSNVPAASVPEPASGYLCLCFAILIGCCRPLFLNLSLKVLQHTT